MSQRWVRILVAALAFVLVAGVGIVIFGKFNAPAQNGVNVTGANSFALILAIALLVAFVAYAGVEYAQTRRLDSIAAQFDTRTIVLMPLAIAINIVLGQTVQNALKIPVYLDSIGTILVGALAGPIPGALTGFLANILWTYVVPPPFHSDFSGAFAIVAAAIGLLAGAYGRVGWLRPRPDRSIGQLFAGAVVAILLVAVIAYYTYARFYASTGLTFFGATTNPVFIFIGWIALIVVVLALVGFLALLFIRRDLTVAYVVAAGIATGVVAALISAPISANVFSGVTASGADFLVAAFRQAGSDIASATFQQGLLQDPIDKLVEFLVVYLILTAMAVRLKARFPQGERLIAAETGAPHGAAEVAPEST